MRVHYATHAEFIRAEPHKAMAECELCGWENYRCTHTRYAGECDFGGCLRTAEFVAVQPMPGGFTERRPVCAHDAEWFSQSLGYVIER